MNCSPLEALRPTAWVFVSAAAAAVTRWSVDVMRVIDGARFVHACGAAPVMLGASEQSPTPSPG